MYATIPSRSVTVNPLTRLMRKKQPHSEPPAATERDGKTLDERVRRSRAAVIGATTQLLVERGFGGATVDEISRRSGVAKTTIYRHWPTRIDLSPRMLDRAGARGLDVREASVTNIPFPDATFDATCAFKVLAHVPEIGRALAEMARVTRDGGRRTIWLSAKTGAGQSADSPVTIS